jgi:hypothetical protein
MKTNIIIIIFIFSNILINAQDIIYKIDRTEIKSKVLEVTTSTIRYSVDNKMKDISIREVFMIVYENGEKEIFKHNNKTSKISKSAINIIIIDERADPIIVGDIPGPIRGTRMKAKDKKNKVFPFATNRFKKVLTQNGFNSEVSSNSNYFLTLNITKLFYKSFDNVVYLQIEQFCSTNITLTDKNNNIIYSKDLSGSFSSKANYVRDYIKQNGYKTRTAGTIFLIVIDDVIKELMNDEKFLNHLL